MAQWSVVLGIEEGVYVDRCRDTRDNAIVSFGEGKCAIDQDVRNRNIVGKGWYGIQFALGIKGNHVCDTLFFFGTQSLECL
jgi:hypothetical protein